VCCYDALIAPAEPHEEEEQAEAEAEAEAGSSVVYLLEWFRWHRPSPQMHGGKVDRAAGRRAQSEGEGEDESARIKEAIRQQYAERHDAANAEAGGASTSDASSGGGSGRSVVHLNQLAVHIATAHAERFDPLILALLGPKAKAKAKAEAEAAVSMAGGAVSGVALWTLPNLAAIHVSKQ
jgi:hypothetical protein